MKRYLIEREIPQVGMLDRDQLQAAAKKSCDVLRELEPDIHWIQSSIAKDKTFCVYLAKNEEIIARHAELSGFPVNKITEIPKIIDPTAERG